LTPEKLFPTEEFLGCFFSATNQNETFCFPCCHIAESGARDWKWKATCLEKSELRSTFPKVEINFLEEEGKKVKFTGEITTGEGKWKIRKLSEENVSSENDTICYMKAR
jgi:hypothetical protein